MLPLYSGVEIRTTSAAAICLAQALDLAVRIVGVAILVVVGKAVEALEQLDLDARLARARRPRAAAPCCATPRAGFRRWSGSASGLRGLDGRDAHQQLDLVGDEQVAVRKRLIPLEVELAAVDHAGELEADALVAPRVGAALGDDAGQLDRLGDALDRDLAVQADLARRRRGSPAVEWKVISGWFSASKNSGEAR